MHLVLLIAWVAMIPVSILTGWIASVVFIGACSLYANTAAHWAAMQAARAEEESG